jgi:hypothetical protein
VFVYHCTRVVTYWLESPHFIFKNNESADIFGERRVKAKIFSSLNKKNLVSVTPRRLDLKNLIWALKIPCTQLVLRLVKKATMRYQWATKDPTTLWK